MEKGPQTLPQVRDMGFFLMKLVVGPLTEKTLVPSRTLQPFLTIEKKRTIKNFTNLCLLIKRMDFIMVFSNKVECTTGQAAELCRFL